MVAVVAGRPRETCIDRILLEGLGDHGHSIHLGVNRLTAGVLTHSLLGPTEVGMSGIARGAPTRWHWDCETYNQVRIEAHE